MCKRSEALKKKYNLEKHVEGGSFAKVYTAPFEDEGRSYMGSIYFLLDKEEISHFHLIDCDEIWYFHEGCGMKITVIDDEGKKKEFQLGNDTEKGEKAMVVINKGWIFGAENLDKNSYSFVSCVTTPEYRDEGFNLVYKKELKEGYPDICEEVSYLAY